MLQQDNAERSGKGFLTKQEARDDAPDRRMRTVTTRAATPRTSCHYALILALTFLVTRFPIVKCAQSGKYVFYYATSPYAGVASSHVVALCLNPGMLKTIALHGHVAPSKIIMEL
jgi:hypothetical protein